MRQKQMKVEAENQEVAKSSLKNKLFVVLMLLTGLVGAGLTVWKINKKVEVGEINNYVCEIVHTDPDVGILAMRCMAKKVE